LINSYDTYLTLDVQANNIACPARNSGLNPLGNPLKPQLGQASEFLPAIPPFTSDTLFLTGMTLDTNSTQPYISGAAQGVVNDRNICAFSAPNHQNKELSLIDNFTYNFDFQQSFSEPFLAQYLTAGTSQEESTLLSDCPTPSSSCGKFYADCMFT
jgi:hypothetical protein